VNTDGDAGSRVWADAALAAALCAIDPAGLGGVALRARAGPVRDRWLELLRSHLPLGAPVRMVPLHISDGRLLGGLDLTATLQAGRPVAERGVLADANGGVAILAMAERISGATAARITAALDRGEIAIERDGLALNVPTRFGVIALDEGAEPDEHAPPALLDRLAFHLDLETVGIRFLDEAGPTPSEVAAARGRMSAIRASDAMVEALTATAMALGIDSMRAVHLALRAACAVAALAGRSIAEDDDAATAGRLVFAARATRFPAPPEDNSEEQTPPPEAEPDSSDERTDDGEDLDRPLEDMVLAAVQAALPAAVLAQLAHGASVAARSRSGGRAGAMQQTKLRGRPAGTRRGEPRAGARLNVVETLRNSAPWQPIRRRETGRGMSAPRIDVRPEDFRVTRFKQRSQTTTIFVVDASGSSALNRLAEAKGAVELLLAECYVRRDQVALIAFRGRGAELLLPPTRSLVRAKRGLAGLPGGGGTPLAAGIDAAVELADAVRRKGDTPNVILLTDGRSNVTRDGNPGRAQAEMEAMSAAHRLRLAGFAAILLDTSPRPQPQAEKLAQEMGARYIPLPYADAATLSRVIRVSALPPAVH